MRTGVAVAFGSILLWSGRANAEEQPDLSDLSIEQLAQIKVTSASKTAEPLSEAPAALYVIRGQDIEDSGVMSLPEALRLAPNLNVQQVTASSYAIGARGFNGIQAGNKLLGLIDGRSIYTPLADNVIWELHQPLVEDIQQIEVISGPGGTLYGPNAVNGVINVITKSAQDTIGGLVRGTVGPAEQSAGARYGFSLGSSGALRIYADWHNRDGLPAGVGADADDDFRGWQTGFRTDFGGERDSFMLKGNLLHATVDLLDGDHLNAHSLNGRWSHVLGPNAAFTFQSTYDGYKRDVALVRDSLATFDNNAQLNVTAGSHEIVAGAGARRTKDLFVNGANAFQVVPNGRKLWVYNMFAQDRYSVTPGLSLIAGVKLEKSSFVGWQVLPNVRLAYQTNPRALFWAAVSKAIRTPSRIDRELQLPPLLLPSSNFDTEKLTAVEAGYRGEPARWLNLSVNLFYNFYKDLRTTEFLDGNVPPIELLNGQKGTTYGIEVWGKAQLLPWWRISLGATTLHKDFHVVGDRVDLQPVNSLGVDPHWQVVGSSDMDVTSRLKLNLNLRAVDDLDRAPAVSSYVEAGGKLGYDLTERVELFVAGRNLLHRTHLENGDPGASQRARRSIYAGTRLSF